MTNAKALFYRFAIVLGSLAFLGFLAAPANADELLVNGNFETGTFAGWTVANLAGSSPGSNWFIDTPGTTTPFSGFPTLGNPLGGSFYAVTDMGGPGTHVLFQSFTVSGPASSVILSFQMFANNQNPGGTFVNPAGLNHNAVPNQHARVDILASGSGPFDIGPAVLQNFFLGADAGPNPHPFTSYSFDITGLVGGGGTFILRFGEVDNQFFYHMGVDNVSINATAQQVPEPGSLSLLVLGVLGIVGSRWRRRKEIG